jgi:hypothetical protein
MAVAFPFEAVLGKTHRREPVGGMVGGAWGKLSTSVFHQPFPADL